MASHTFLWHEYETFGINPRRDRPAQFAGIRTDAELNEVGEPQMVYCQPANDYLPDPASCLISVSRAILFDRNPSRAAAGIRAEINAVIGKLT